MQSGTASCSLVRPGCFSLQLCSLRRAALRAAVALPHLAARADLHVAPAAHAQPKSPGLLGDQSSAEACCFLDNPRRIGETPSRRLRNSRRDRQQGSGLGSRAFALSRLSRCYAELRGPVQIRGRGERSYGAHLVLRGSRSFLREPAVLRTQASAQGGEGKCSSRAAFTGIARFQVPTHTP